MSNPVNNTRRAINPRLPSLEEPNVLRSERFTYRRGDILGTGSFGQVSIAHCVETNERVAIKKVQQDPRYKNRELDVMKVLDHPNVVNVKDYFYTDGDDGAVYLNVVMEFMPTTVHGVVRRFLRAGHVVPPLLVKLYSYQILRSLGYLHSLGICHRDIKPQNLLVDVETAVLKLCDFGSAKQLNPGESSVSYICSRYYRAPELMLGAERYTTSIDIWSIGCVIAEIMLGQPLFPGETSVDQLVKIISALGTPTPDQMAAMNPTAAGFSFPSVQAKPWDKVIPITDGLALNFLKSLLRYEPELRVPCYDALAHQWFDELREEDLSMPSGASRPSLFNFSNRELSFFTSETARQKVIPGWYKQTEEFKKLRAEPTGKQ